MSVSIGAHHVQRLDMELFVDGPGAMVGQPRRLTRLPPLSHSSRLPKAALSTLSAPSAKNFTYLGSWRLAFQIILLN